MTHLRPRDKASLACLLPLWSVCFAFSVRSALRQTAIPAVYVSAPEEEGGYPAVAGFRPDLHVVNPGLRTGDRLLRLGSTDLRGMGPIAFFVRVAQERSGEAIPVTLERGGKREESMLPVESYRYFVWPVLPLSLVLVPTAVVLLVRAPGSPMVRALSAAFMWSAIAYAAVFGGSPLETYASIAINSFSAGLFVPLIIRALICFPTTSPRRACRGGWDLGCSWWGCRPWQARSTASRSRRRSGS